MNHGTSLCRGSFPAAGRSRAVTCGAASFGWSRIRPVNLAGGNGSTHGRMMPYCMYTDPPLARVDLSEEEAIRKGLELRLARIPTASSH